MEVGFRYTKFEIMIQDIDRPARTVTHEVETMHFNIKDPLYVTCGVEVEIRDGSIVTKSRNVIQVKALLEAKIASGDITAANAAGFKRCMKLICAEALGIALADTNDPL